MLHSVFRVSRTIEIRSQRKETKLFKFITESIHVFVFCLYMKNNMKNYLKKKKLYFLNKTDTKTYFK